MYSTDNGPHRNSWPDGGTTPFRSEKATNWEGAFRIPLLVRWTGKIKAGSICNDIIQHHDWLPTFMAMVGAEDVVEKLKKGYKAIGRTYKNHIDGYNFLPYLTGQVKKGPRNAYFYFSDDGDLVALRFDNWKGCIHGTALQGNTAGLGGAIHEGCGCRSFTTCEPILTNSPIPLRIPIGTGTCRMQSWPSFHNRS
jgi:arylsulfatase